MSLFNFYRAKSPTLTEDTARPESPKAIREDSADLIRLNGAFYRSQELDQTNCAGLARTCKTLDHVLARSPNPR